MSDRKSSYFWLFNKKIFISINDFQYGMNLYVGVYIMYCNINVDRMLRIFIGKKLYDRFFQYKHLNKNMHWKFIRDEKFSTKNDERHTLPHEIYKKTIDHFFKTGTHCFTFQPTETPIKTIELLFLIRFPFIRKTPRPVFHDYHFNVNIYATTCRVSSSRCG